MGQKMLFLGCKNTDLTVEMSIGNMGVGTFALGYFGPGTVAPLGKQGPPYVSLATFSVPWTIISGWQPPVATLGIQVIAAAIATAASLPLTLTLMQTVPAGMILPAGPQLLVALDANGNPINGSSGPGNAHPISVGTMTSGGLQNIGFGVHFQ